MLINRLFLSLRKLFEGTLRCTRGDQATFGAIYSGCCGTRSICGFRLLLVHTKKPIILIILEEHSGHNEFMRLVPP